MAKPAVTPVWADTDVVDPTSGKNNVATPPANYATKGWAFDEFPPRQYANWLYRWLCRWVAYLDTTVDAMLISIGLLQTAVSGLLSSIGTLTSAVNKRVEVFTGGKSLAVQVSGMAVGTLSDVIVKFLAYPVSGGSDTETAGETSLFISGFTNKARGTGDMYFPAGTIPVGFEPTVETRIPIVLKVDTLFTPCCLTLKTNGSIYFEYLNVTGSGAYGASYVANMPLAVNYTLPPIKLTYLQY